ncbi:replication-relaxation family protein [Gulosibacter molinativorax]|uniref:Replication-relaxation n=1 Tax=Gulosibacter molinativorax TaxID=256821 RepID=A0ABT7CBY5_9MICO|nr:replication-relaxation family protein [Gulosibacter molinativorax]MDJ1372660.1 hypothetical protein [Gulosibacter molinativorax]QUY62396.1 Hypotetical protein [Gulosibacter molinativorax]
MNYVQIPKLITQLSQRDLAVLTDLRELRLLSTPLVQRLHFPIGSGGHQSQAAASKATMRSLRRLKGLELLTHLERRIGGVRHGSSSYIWQLTSQGDRVLRHRNAETGRSRYMEPSLQFVQHTLAIATAVVDARTAARDGQFDLIALTPEPGCWREFIGPNGTTMHLKPDLHLITATGDYEDHWFVEVDRATENLQRILAKCSVYARYAASGREQAETGVFPAVLWLVPDEARASAIRGAITGDSSLPHGLFSVVPSHHFVASLTASGEPPGGVPESPVGRNN